MHNAAVEEYSKPGWRIDDDNAACVGALASGRSCGRRRSHLRKEDSAATARKSGRLAQRHHDGQRTLVAVALEFAARTVANDGGLEV